ncbi:aspartate aminotransferase family protein [Agrobacterium tumefaciens]|uniref:aspartate aminotransferase family protein n=1 Tax=Agrobacterium tumefaciens TaxID=358 RepID=UPI00287DF7B4|nr:aspartate aminotransferase family protein [Agrobacterium tumefaciens]MDS7594010.1 aspartate aminotransferase family protein [Agrobacterium tumefaciens]
MASNNELIASRAEAVIPGGLLSPSRRLGSPIAFARADGPYLYDADGTRYTDYHCAFGANVLGHRNPAISRAIARVGESLDLVGAGVLELEVEVAELLVKAIPCADQVAFCSSGSEATYHALRLARAYTGRKQIIKFQGGYHGWHDYVAMNGQSSRQMIDAFDPMSDGILYDAARYTKILPYNDATAVEEYIRANPGEVAAVIIEPIAHNMGAVVAQNQFLRDLRRITSENGVILIFDEVITGFRHALGGYQSIVGITPDLATFGKAATSGYPIGLVAGRRDIMERVGRTGEGAVFMGGTFNGTPSSMAAVKATVQELSKPGVYDRLFDRGSYLRKQIDEIIARHGIRAQTAGFGSVWLVYFFEGEFKEYADLLRNDNELDMRFRRALITGRQIFQPLQLKRLYLSLSHDQTVLDDTLELIDATMADLARSAAA